MVTKVKITPGGLGDIITRNIGWVSARDRGVQSGEFIRNLTIKIPLRPECQALSYRKGYFDEGVEVWTGCPSCSMREPHEPSECRAETIVNQDQLADGISDYMRKMDLRLVVRYDEHATCIDCGCSDMKKMRLNNGRGQRGALECYACVPKRAHERLMEIVAKMAGREIAPGEDVEEHMAKIVDAAERALCVRDMTQFAASQFMLGDIIERADGHGGQQECIETHSILSADGAIRHFANGCAGKTLRLVRRHVATFDGIPFPEPARRPQYSYSDSLARATFYCRNQEEIHTKAEVHDRFMRAADIMWSLDEAGREESRQEAKRLIEMAKRFEKWATTPVTFRWSAVEKQTVPVHVSATGLGLTLEWYE